MIISDLYQTKIECLKDGDGSSYYNVNIDATDVRVVVSLVDFNGNPVTGKSVTLSVDRGSITSVKTGYTGTVASGGKSVTGTTGSDGKFAVLYTASEWGLATFSTNTTNTQINVKGHRGIGISEMGTLLYDDSIRVATLILHKSGLSFTAGETKRYTSTALQTYGRIPGNYVSSSWVTPNMLVLINGNSTNNINIFCKDAGTKDVNASFTWMY